MTVMKKKFLVPGTVIFFSLLIYLLTADEDLELTTKLWLGVLENDIEVKDNASLQLLSLGKIDPIFIKANNKTYNKKLEEFKYDGVLGDEKPMKYPNVLQFEAFLESPLFCDFIAPDCFERVREQADYLYLVIEEFEPELQDFMSLNRVENFKALNPFVAEIKLEDFIFLFKLKGTEIYFDIENGELEKASCSLNKLISINRQFFAKSDDLLTKVSFSLNTKNIFQPLLTLLSNSAYATTGKFDDVLRPLSMSEISANEIQKRSFAKNARLIKAGLSARKQNSSDSIFGKFWHRFFYKQNTTLNDMFDEYQPLMLPSYISKSSLLSFSDKIDQAIYERQREQSQQTFTYRLKNMTNLIGTSLKDIVMPRQVNVYNSIAILDTRLQLLRLMLQAETYELETLMQLEAYANYYSGSLPFISEDKVCHRINEEDVCVYIDTSR